MCVYVCACIRMQQTVFPTGHLNLCQGFIRWLRVPLSTPTHGAINCPFPNTISLSSDAWLEMTAGPLAVSPCYFWNGDTSLGLIGTALSFS